MRKTFFALTAIALFASCGQAGTDTATKKDSAAKAPATQMAVGEPAPPCDEGLIEAPLIPYSQGDSMIQAYHRSIGLKNNPNQNVSFQLNANSLRCALNNAPNISKLDIYLAQGSDGKMTLVYVGAYDSTGTDGKTYTVEHTYVKPDGSQWVMDNTIPCPLCTKIGIHTPPNQ